MTIGAGAALPVSLSTDAPQAGPAIPVVVVSDGRPTQAGPAQPVVVVTTGPVQAGAPIPVVASAAGRPVAGGRPIPVYVVSGSFGPAAYALFRDVFTTAQSPVIDGAAEPGAGRRDVTGSLLAIADGWLRGGAQPSSPAWGASVYAGLTDALAAFTRAGGRTFCVLFGPEDFANDFAIGWLANPASDPRTNGHCIVNESGSLSVSTPGLKVVIDASAHFIRSSLYLFGVTLMPAGAIYWGSTFAADDGAQGGMLDRVGFPAPHPVARIFWVEETDTTALLIPTISYYDQAAAYPGGHAADDARVVDVPSWTAQNPLATFYDTFNRADSNITPGNNWASIAGVWGIIGGRLYNVSGSGFRTVYQPNLGGPDATFRWKVILSSTPTAAFRLTLRHADSAGNMIVLNSNGSTTALSLQKWVANNFSSTIDNFTLPTTLTASSTHIFTLEAYGNRYKLYQNGLECNGGSWSTDAGNNNLAALGIGYGVANTDSSLIRVEEVSVTPFTVTLPSEITDGAGPAPWTTGATLFSDTFTGADGTNLTTLGYGNERGTWTEQSNRATCSGLAAGSNLTTRDAGQSDVEASVDLITPGAFATNTIRAGLVLRYVDLNNHIIVRLYRDAGTGEIEIIETIGGSGGVVHKTDITAAGVAVATTYTLAVQLLGRQIRVTLGGKSRLFDLSQSGSPLGTRHGLYREGAPFPDDGVVFDNIVVKTVSV